MASWQTGTMDAFASCVIMLRMCSAPAFLPLTPRAMTAALRTLISPLRTRSTRVLNASSCLIGPSAVATAALTYGSLARASLQSFFTFFFSPKTAILATFFSVLNVNPPSISRLPPEQESKPNLPDRILKKTWCRKCSYNRNNTLPPLLCQVIYPVC